MNKLCKSGVEYTTHRDRGDVHLGLGGDQISLVDPAKGAAVVLHGAGDENETGTQLLQHYHTLALHTPKI